LRGKRKSAVEDPFLPSARSIPACRAKCPNCALLFAAKETFKVVVLAAAGGRKEKEK